MGWIRCIRCKKLQRDFVGRTFVLIAPVQYVLQQVSCSYARIPNAPKYYETHGNICIGSNGVDWLFSLRKIPLWLRGTNFCNNCTSSPRFAPTFMQLRNDLKCTEILWNRLKLLFRVHKGWIGCVCWEKSRRDFAASTFALIAPVHPVLHQVSCSYEMIPNGPKHYETHQNKSLGSNGVDQVRSLRTFVLTAPVQYVLHQVSCTYETIPNAPKYYETDRNISLESNRVDWVCLLRKIPTWHYGTNFYINCTSSPRFAPSFMQLRNDLKWTQTLWNAPKHEFRVQWGG